MSDIEMPSNLFPDLYEPSQLVYLLGCQCPPASYFDGLVVAVHVSVRDLACPDHFLALFVHAAADCADVLAVLIA